MFQFPSHPKTILSTIALILSVFVTASVVAAWYGARSGGGWWFVAMWCCLAGALAGIGALAVLGWKLASVFDASGKVLESFAEGDLSPRAPTVAGGFVASMARSVNSIGEAQCALVTELREASQALDRESESFQSAFSRIKSQSHRSREASGTVAAALEELSVGVGLITKEVLEVNEIALGACGSSRRLNGMAFDASVSVSRQYLSLQTTSAAMGKAKESMVELEKSGAEIAGMAEGIMDVAKRTRLLALNASIEAARAGEKGRGFAVVAQEVKELAHQAGRMAERIQGQVEAVSRGTEKVAQELSETETSLRGTMGDAFLALVSVEHQCALSYESSRGLETTSQNMSEIARTIEESKSALDEINRSTHELDMRARAVDAAIEGAQTGLDEIGRFARSFQGTVKEMKVRAPFFPWSDDLSVGLGRMDDQHKVLLRLINRVADLTESGGGGASIRIVVGQLVDYTKFHFQDEEKLMAAAGFPDLAAHRKVHEGFVAEVGRMVAKATEGDSIDAASLLPVLKDWLVRHIKGTDKVYGAHVVASQSRDGGVG